MEHKAQIQPVEKIDYKREYLERFDKAQRGAEARGLKYKHPGKVGLGWKIHLNLSDDPKDPLTESVARFTTDERYAYKVGQGGEQEEGKGMTIYIGDRDTLNEFAQKLDKAFGNQLRPAMGQVMHDDMQIEGNVWARFEVGGLVTPQGELHQYGYHGISFLVKDYSRVLDNWRNDTITWDEGYARANEVLEAEFGAFYTGSTVKSKA